MSVMDLSARYDLPDMRRVQAKIEYHESDPVPCIGTEYWRERDFLPGLPGLPGLREYLSHFEETRDRAIAAVEVWVDTPQGREMLPFVLHRPIRGG